jgi:DNA-binding CsgD family transcriptional regulator
MARLTDKDYRDILNLVYLANRCEDVESLLTALFPSVMQTFSTECATFHLIQGYPRSIKVVESRSFKFDNNNLCEDIYYPGLYKDSFYKHSPLLTAALSSPQIALKIGNSISFRDWNKSVLYNDFIRPQNLYWELFLTLRCKGNLEGMITLWRSKSQPDYGDREVLKATKLASHLGLAVHNVCLISRLNTPKSHLLPADEADSEGLLWLDHRFTPSFFNTKARDICLQLLDGKPYSTSDIEKGEFPIPACIVEDCSDLLDIVKAKGRSILLPKERIVYTQSGQRLQIECSLMWNRGQASATPNFMVTLSDLNEENKLETTFQTRFGLSRRELDIIYYLIRGLSDAEIGEKLYISRQTVHTHTKNIYKKLGAKSRIELYRKVMQSRYPKIFNHQFSSRYSP